MRVYYRTLKLLAARGMTKQRALLATATIYELSPEDTVRLARKAGL